MLSSQLLPKLFEIIARQYLHKGGLISDCFSFWLKSPKMGAKSRPWAMSIFSLEPWDLAPIFWNLSQSEKLSTPLLAGKLTIQLLTLIRNFQQGEKYVVNIYVHLFSFKKITLVFIAKDSTKNRFVLRSTRLSKWKIGLRQYHFRLICFTLNSFQS